MKEIFDDFEVKKLLKAIEEFPYSTIAELSKLTKQSFYKTKKYLEELSRHGIVKYNKVNRTKKWYINKVKEIL